MSTPGEVLSAPGTTGQRAPAAEAAWKVSVRRYVKLLAYLRPQWRSLAFVVVAMLVEVGLQLLRPWPLKLLVDNVLGHHPIPQWLIWLPGANTRSGLIPWVVGGELLIYLLGTAAGMLYMFASMRLGQRMAYALGADLFRHLQRMSLIFHSRRPVGDMISRVTGDAWCTNTIVLDALVPLAQAAITLVSMFLIMWKLQSTLTLMALGVTPFFLIVIKGFGRRIKDRTREQRDLESRMMSVVEQTLNAIPVVQAFTREDVEHNRFRHYADRTVDAYRRATFVSALFDLGAGLVTTLGTVAIMYVGARLALDGKLTPGAIIVFLSYLGSLYAPLDSMTHTTQTVMGVGAEVDRVMEILETPPEVQDRPDARDAEVGGPIRYEHVTFGYEPGHPAVRDVSFAVEPGEVLAMVGPTGAGKTTLVNLLIRFYDPWSGRITIGGADIREFRHRSLRQQVALVLQDPFILPLTVAENIAYGCPDASREAIVAAAKAANAHDFISRLPEGYDAVIGERGSTLSGGEKQRLSIARAFLKDAPILILDEPTSALDARTEGLLLEALERLMEGRIAFVIAHRLSTIRAADQIVVIEHGELVERGSHDELLERDGLYAELYKQQTGVR